MGPDGCAKTNSAANPETNPHPVNYWCIFLSPVSVEARTPRNANNLQPIRQSPGRFPARPLTSYIQVISPPSRCAGMGRITRILPDEWPGFPLSQVLITLVFYLGWLIGSEIAQLVSWVPTEPRI